MVKFQRTRCVLLVGVCTWLILSIFYKMNSNDNTTSRPIQYSHARERPNPKRIYSISTPVQAAKSNVNWTYQPFAAIWNDANFDNCQREFGIHLNLTAYGIATGPAYSVIFYNKNLGLYPWIGNGVAVNGGIPQLVNLTSHLEKATIDILTRIPDVHYSGIAVIDWEYWQPLWSAHSNGAKGNIYKDMSISLVRRRHPDWDNTLVEEVARLEFEQAAKSLFESTILLARKLRPSALWGLYHFPYCMVDFTTGNCTQAKIQANDEMQWLYANVKALYPSIYLPILKRKEILKQPIRYVQGNLGEAFRVRNNIGKPLTPVFSYCRYRYPLTQRTLSKEHLRDTILLSAEMAVSGVVIWISFNDTKTKENCLELQQYIATGLGPLIKTTTDAASRCSQLLCSGHGKCLGKILTCAKTAPSVELKDNGRAPSETRHQRLLSESAGNSSVTEKCSCQCYAGWEGETCNLKSRVKS